MWTKFKDKAPSSGSYIFVKVPKYYGSYRVFRGRYLFGSFELGKGESKKYFPYSNAQFSNWALNYLDISWRYDDLKRLSKEELEAIEALYGVDKI